MESTFVHPQTSFKVLEAQEAEHLTIPMPLLSSVEERTNQSKHHANQPNCCQVMEPHHVIGRKIW